jgi:hypothetical protein
LINDKSNGTGFAFYPLDDDVIEEFRIAEEKYNMSLVD